MPKSVTVVWGATDGRDSKTYVVGWWEKATIHGEWQPRPDAKKIKEEIEKKFPKEKDSTVSTVLPARRQMRSSSQQGIENSQSQGEQVGWEIRGFIFTLNGGEDGVHQTEHEELRKNIRKYIREHIKAYSSSSHPQSTGQPAFDIIEESMLGVREEALSPEGGKKWMTHWKSERNPALVKTAKQAFRKKHNGKLFCEVGKCAFNFVDAYGDLGKNPLPHIASPSYHTAFEGGA